MPTLKDADLLSRAIKTFEDDALECIDLDELVHDIASQVASAVNNGGTVSQLMFLIENDVLDETMVRAWEARRNIDE